MNTFQPALWRRHKSSQQLFALSMLGTVILCLTLVADVAAAITYYVDVDSIGGSSSDNNPGTIDQPFRTIVKARDTIRETGVDGVTVYIRGGVYSLLQTLTFDSRDSGSSGAPNVYMAYPGESPMLKGAMRVPINEFTVYSGPILRADLSSYSIYDLSQVFLNGKRLILARYPDYDPADPIRGGYLYVADDTSGSRSEFKYKAGDVDPSGWTNIQDARVNMHLGWWNDVQAIGTINTNDRTVELSSPLSGGIRSHNRYHFQNVFEELNDVNEWYWDRNNRILYVYPPRTMTGSDILTVAVADNLIVVDGAEHIQFKGITVGECNGKNFYISNSNFIAIDNCNIANSGQEGIEINDGTNITLNSCEISETGLGGIYAHNNGPYFAALRRCDYKISGNTIHDTSVFKTQAGSILIKTVGAKVSFNHIYDVPRAGIQFLGNDNIIEYNHIHNVNRESCDSGAIGTYGKTWVMRGNVIRHNYIHDTGGYGWNGRSWTSPYDTYGIYLDDFASGSHIYGNTIRTNCRSGIFVHSGRDNIIENNTIIESSEAAQVHFIAWDRENTGLDYLWWQIIHVLTSQASWDGEEYLRRYPELSTITEAHPPQDELMSGNKFINNIIIYPESSTNLYSIKWLDYSTTEIDNNTIWAGSKDITVALIGVAKTWDWWKDLGFDNNSRDVTLTFSDPPNGYILFVNTDVEEKEFSLGGEQYRDLNDNPVSGSLTLQPFESRILLFTNQPPVLQPIGSKSVNENALLSFTVSATDADGDTIQYSAQNLPSGATFSNQTLSWTPSYDQAGTYQVRFIATDDGNAYDYETITITVNNVNRAPVLGPIANQSVNENALLSFSVSATDADGQTITYSVNGLSAGAVFAGQTFTWTPSYDQAGTYQVTFTADDGQAQDSQTITITVIHVNRAPVLTAIGNRTAYADVLLTFTIDATDPDGDAITYSAGTLPSSATFTDQDFDWTPSQGQVGSYDVTFTASDGRLQDSETVTMTVDVDNLAPTVTNCSPAAGSIQVPLNNLITLNIADAGIGVNADSVKIKVRVSSNPNNDTVYFGDTDHYISPEGDCRRLGTEANYRFIYQPTNEMLYYDQTVTITVNATDLAGNVMDEYSYSFATEMHSFGQNKQVNSGLDNNDRPVTVYDSSGNIWTAWHAGSVGNRDIYVSKLAAGEENFSGTVQLTDNTTDQCNPAVALDSNDKLYVVWQDNREGDWDIYISTSVDGINWSAETRINDPNDGNQVNPAIVIDGQSPNYAHVVWQDDSAVNQDIYVATSSNGFATPTVSQQITFDNFDQVEPAIAADSDSTIYVVWTDGRNGSNDIYGAASNNPWTNVAIVSNVNNQSSPAIAAESAGSILHLLWVDNTSGDNDIYYASSDGLPGSPLTGSSIIDDSSGADQLDPTIAVTGSTDNNLKVFACWQDWRNTDIDLFFAELSAGSGTNVFVGDSGSNADQGKPVIGIDEYSHPYLIWADNRSTDTDIYYTGSTFIEPVALASELVTASASSSTTVGTDPQAITTVDDVSILVPAGACSYDVTITLTKIANLPVFAAPCLGGYDFGPSGIQFSQPVTITIPYVNVSGSATPYWFNSLTGALSQQGITDIRDIPVNSSLHALSFKTTHFTAFYLFAGGGAAAAIVGGGGGGGGCSVSASGEGNIVEYILPYIALAVVMAILKMRDVRYRKARNMTAGKC